MSLFPKKVEYPFKLLLVSYSPTLTYHSSTNLTDNDFSLTKLFRGIS